VNSRPPDEDRGTPRGERVGDLTGRHGRVAAGGLDGGEPDLCREARGRSKHEGGAIGSGLNTGRLDTACGTMAGATEYDDDGRPATNKPGSEKTAADMIALHMAGARVRRWRNTSN